jgi:hypothetical protein
LPFGLLLLVASWALAWSGPAPFSEHTFFSLWLGYILTVDGLTYRRVGTSLLTRDPGRFALLFVFSIPVWWIFEFANQFLGNWSYILPREYGPVGYAALASLAFSTVMPAIFATAELMRTYPPFATTRRWIRIAPSRNGLVVIGGLGLVMFIAALVFPHILFPLVWIGLFLLFDTTNALTGGRSLAYQAAVGRWDTVIVLFAAGIACGFFWEMWNYWSSPKWVYEVPLVDRPRLFEMPLLGYGGYLPFALEIYAAYHLLHTTVFLRADHYLRFDREAASLMAKSTTNTR